MLAVALALGVVVLPGAALLHALGVRGPLWLLALSPPLSVMVATVTAMICALVGVRFGPGALVVATAALSAIAVWRWQGRPPRAADEDPGADSDASPLAWATMVAGWLIGAVGVALSVWPWLDGLDGLHTVPQEHDMIVHAVLTAFIERTGDGAPWQLLPVDLLTGADREFYPAGLHLLMATVAEMTDGTVVGMNAVSVIVFGVGWPISVATLAYVACFRGGVARSWSVLGAGVAALVASGLYRPVFSLVNEGGILANGAALVMAPGVLAALIALPVRPRTTAIAAGAACTGIVLVHPSAVATVGISLAAWLAGDALTHRGRAAVRDRVIPFAIAGATALVLALPAIAEILGAAESTTRFRPDTVPTPLGDAVRDTFGHVYGGFVQAYRGQNQLSAVVLGTVGVVASVVTRRAIGAVTALAVWIVIILAAWLRPGEGLHGVVTGFFYHAQLRVWSHMSLFLPVVAGSGIALSAGAVAGRFPRVAGSARIRSGWLVLAAAAALALVYAAVPGRSYARANTEYVASRYGRSEFYRVTEDDKRAIDFLATRVKPGERVLNSANDGSAYLYVERGVPIVSYAPLGRESEPATYVLLQRFNRYPQDAEVRAMLRRLNIRWLYMDSVAPIIGTGPAPHGWAGPGPFSLAPGFSHLDGLPGLVKRFVSGTVSVYELAPSALGEAS